MSIVMRFTTILSARIIRDAILPVDSEDLT